MDELEYALIRLPYTALQDLTGDVLQETKAWGILDLAHHWLPILRRYPEKIIQYGSWDLDYFYSRLKLFKEEWEGLSRTWDVSTYPDYVGMSPEEIEEDLDDDRRHKIRRLFSDYHVVWMMWTDVRKVLKPFEGRDPERLWEDLRNIIREKVDERGRLPLQGPDPHEIWDAFLERVQ